MSTRLSPRCDHRRWRLGLALPTRSPTQLFMRSSGRRCACRQLYVFSSCSGAAQKRPLHRGPLRLRQDSTMSEGNFPAQLLKVFLSGSGSLLEDSFTH